MPFETGMVVESLAGRDKGYWLCVVGGESGCVLVCDGKERPLGRPKRKNPMHLRALPLPPLTWELRGDRALRKALNRLRAAQGTENTKVLAALQEKG